MIETIETSYEQLKIKDPKCIFLKQGYSVVGFTWECSLKLFGGFMSCFGASDKCKSFKRTDD